MVNSKITYQDIYFNIFNFISLKSLKKMFFFELNSNKFYNEITIKYNDKYPN